ncbi:DUF4249 domain-containing protein [Thermophagus sp. OGC60D27]|uniref:DUF4249 domain-containing protein n=1 Tax=Thermophagus sp. OGC60D27 TaxID=3458415 RepID=UPI0040383DB6
MKQPQSRLIPLGILIAGLPKKWKNSRLYFQIKTPGLVVSLVSALMVFNACTETIDLELESANKRLVVDGLVMSNQRRHFVRLTQSVPFLSDSASPLVSDATVLLTDGEITEQLSESDEFPGVYISPGNILGQSGKTYFLSISDVDINEDGVEEEYTAHCYMPAVTMPDSINIVYDSTWNIWKVLLYAKDNLETEDYYLFRVFKNGTLISDRLGEFSIVSDQFFVDGVADGIWIQSIAAGEDQEVFAAGDVITLQMCGITEEYFRFIESVQEENRFRYPLFSGPPANAEGNISNGGLGFFAAFSAQYASFRFDEVNLVK